jgi:hypothetical protein
VSTSSRIGLVRKWRHEARAMRPPDLGRARMSSRTFRSRFLGPLCNLFARARRSGPRDDQPSGSPRHGLALAAWYGIGLAVVHITASTGTRGPASRTGSPSAPVGRDPAPRRSSDRRPSSSTIPRGMLPCRNLPVSRSSGRRLPRRCGSPGGLRMCYNACEAVGRAHRLRRDHLLTSWPPNEPPALSGATSPAARTSLRQGHVRRATMERRPRLCVSRAHGARGNDRPSAVIETCATLRAAPRPFPRQ